MCGWGSTMRIDCLHGYFKFSEIKAGELSKFRAQFDLDLELHKDGYFTFPFLIEAPKYAIEGSTYLGAQVTKTFEGEPWDILRENSLVYDFVNDELALATTISTNVQFVESGFYFVSSGLIRPGSLTKNGNRIVNYSGFFLREFSKFKYSAVGYV